MSSDGSTASNCLCEPDYECDHCGSQLQARISEYEARDLTTSDERRAMEADAAQEPSPSAMLAGIHITKYQPQDCECRGKHEHRYGYTKDCTVRDCTCGGAA